METPNFDAMSVQELEEAARHLQTLKNYTRAKALAVSHRLEGRIALAICSEAECDRLYETLPAQFRW